MRYKNIIVIDDAGDVFGSVSGLFKDDLEIKILHSKSNLVDLKKSLKRDAYMILINEDDLKSDLNQLFESIKNHLFYFTVPIMILSSDEDLVRNPELMDFPIVNYALKPFDEENSRCVLNIALKYLSITGISMIYQDFLEVMSLTGNYWVNYLKILNLLFIFLDLDNFKVFGEYYGLYQGSQVLLFLSNLLHDTLLKYGSIDDFIGHVGGDDFVIILNDYKRVDLICNEIITQFDKKIVDYYGGDDLKNGYIEVVNMAGEVEKLKVMGISVIAINYMDFKTNTFDEVYKKIMKIKKEAKMIDGSVFLNK